MPPPDWGLFVAGALLATTATLGLSWLSTRQLSAWRRTGAGDGTPGVPAGSAVPGAPALLGNVLLTHGLLAVALVALVRVTGVPAAAIGIADHGPRVVGVGLALGVGLFLAAEAVATVARRAGVEYDAWLREAMAPSRPAEWALLLGGALPVIAVAEELLFRAVLVGGLGAALDGPVAVLVVASSVLFGLGHTAQGAVGVAVTAALGLVLGAAFVLTGSLIAVVVAHYVVDALEFVVREGVLG